MIDLSSPLLLNPESIQAPINLTAVRRGQGWRPLPNLPVGHFPGVVRLLIQDDDAGEMRVIGSGSAIGCFEDRWLVIATATHVLEDMDKELQWTRRLERVPGPESREEQIRKRHDKKVLPFVRCGVWVPALHTEVLCPIARTQTATNTRVRDTALVCVELPLNAHGKVPLLPIDVGPPPQSHLPLHIAGFNHIRLNERPLAVGPPLLLPERRLIMREGYLDSFGPGSGLLAYPVAKFLIPVDPKMSGGAVIIYRPAAYHSAGVLVAIINGETTLRENAAQHPECDGAGYGSPVITLYTHEVPMPDGSWIWFKEAVRRGIIATSGADPHHVVLKDGRLVVDASASDSNDALGPSTFWN
jgi:hypothetical protein